MLSAQGRIKMQLHGPQGDLNGVLLDDGTIIHLPPPEAERLAAWLAPGQVIYAQGDGLASPLGKVIGAQAIGPSQAQAIAIAAPPPPRGPRGPKPGRWAGGFMPTAPVAGAAPFAPGLMPPPPPAPGPAAPAPAAPPAAAPAPLPDRP